MTQSDTEGPNHPPPSIIDRSLLIRAIQVAPTLSLALEIGPSKLPSTATILYVRTISSLMNPQSPGRHPSLVQHTAWISCRISKMLAELTFLYPITSWLSTMMATIFMPLPKLGLKEIFLQVSCSTTRIPSIDKISQLRTVTNVLEEVFR